MKGAALLLGACVALAAMVALLSSTGWVRRTALISRPVRGAEVRVLPERRRRVALRQQALCSELREQGQALAAREGLVGRDAQMLVAYQLGGQCNLDLSGAYLTYYPTPPARWVDCNRSASLVSGVELQLGPASGCEDVGTKPDMVCTIDRMVKLSRFGSGSTCSRNAPSSPLQPSDNV